MKRQARLIKKGDVIRLLVEGRTQEVTVTRTATTRDYIMATVILPGKGKRREVKRTILKKHWVEVVDSE